MKIIEIKTESTENFEISIKKVLDDITLDDDREELILRDYKPFDMHGTKVGIGQLEVIDLAIFDSVKDELQADLEKLRIENNLHTTCLILTDIMKEGSEVLVSSTDASIFEKAFNCKLVDGKVWLDGCLSRKKQIIPFLEPAFA